MTDKPTWKQIQEDRDKRVVLPLEPDEALSGLLEAEVENEIPDNDDSVSTGDSRK